MAKVVEIWKGCLPDWPDACSYVDKSIDVQKTFQQKLQSLISAIWGCGTVDCKMVVNDNAEIIDTCNIIRYRS